MEKKDFILILVALIILSGGYYLYVNNFWPFSRGAADINEVLAGQIYAVSGVAKEVYETVIIIESEKPVGSLTSTELMVVINEDTEIFRYETTPDDSFVKMRVSPNSIRVGDTIAVSSDDDISTKVNGVFLASSIAVYNR